VTTPVFDEPRWLRRSASDVSKPRRPNADDHHRWLRSVSDVSRPPEPKPHLTHDELQVLALLARGLTTDRIASRLNMSERTVRRKTRSACDSLNVETTVEAIVWAVRRRLI
jgi:DNA-binding NarL/FixJ family response regulator